MTRGEMLNNASIIWCWRRARRRARRRCVACCICISATPRLCSGYFGKSGHPSSRGKRSYFYPSASCLFSMPSSRKPCGSILLSRLTASGFRLKEAQTSVTGSFLETYVHTPLYHSVCVLMKTSTLSMFNWPLAATGERWQSVSLDYCPS